MGSSGQRGFGLKRGFVKGGLLTMVLSLQSTSICKQIDVGTLQHSYARRLSNAKGIVSMCGMSLFVGGHVKE
eukprot:1232481-Amphidinium_carterae.1